MKKKFKPIYSGNQSKELWKRINSLPEKHQHCLYSVFCLVQDVEARALHMLNEVDSFIELEKD